MKADIGASGAVAAASTCFDRRVREEDSLPHRYNYCACIMPVLPFKLSNILLQCLYMQKIKSPCETKPVTQVCYSTVETRCFFFLFFFSVEVFIHFITYCDNVQFTCDFFFFTSDFIYMLAVLVKEVCRTSVLS